MKMIASPRTIKIVRAGIILAAAAFSSAGGSAQGADLFDSPGPGYRQQKGELRGGQIERLDLLDALPRGPVAPITRGAAEAMFSRLNPSLKRAGDSWQSAKDLSWLQSECQRLTESLPELPNNNVFAAPFKLFDAPPSSPAHPGETVPPK